MSEELDRLKGAFVGAFVLIENIAARALKVNLESRVIFLSVIEGFIQDRLITRERFAEIESRYQAAMSVEKALSPEAKAMEEVLQKFREVWRKALSGEA